MTGQQRSVHLGNGVGEAPVSQLSSTCLVLMLAVLHVRFCPVLLLQYFFNTKLRGANIGRGETIRETDGRPGPGWTLRHVVLVGGQVVTRQELQEQARTAARLPKPTATGATAEVCALA